MDPPFADLIALRVDEQAADAGSGAALYPTLAPDALCARIEHIR